MNIYVYSRLTLKMISLSMKFRITAAAAFQSVNLKLDAVNVTIP